LCGIAEELVEQLAVAPPWPPPSFAIAALAASTRLGLTVQLSSFPFRIAFRPIR
jgi:hypothetical protein